MLEERDAICQPRYEGNNRKREAACSRMSARRSRASLRAANSFEGRRGPLEGAARGRHVRGIPREHGGTERGNFGRARAGHQVEHSCIGRACRTRFRFPEKEREREGEKTWLSDCSVMRHEKNTRTRERAERAGGVGGGGRVAPRLLLVCMAKVLERRSILKKRHNWVTNQPDGIAYRRVTRQDHRLPSRSTIIAPASATVILRKILRAKNFRLSSARHRFLPGSARPGSTSGDGGSGGSGNGEGWGREGGRGRGRG